jgi:uncharacterized membrane protein
MSGMARFERSIDVNVPLHLAYNQWTQFEEFPHFMEGVKEVVQMTATKVCWRAEILGVEKVWTAQITEQRPNERIVWHSISGAKHASMISFHYNDDSTTRLRLQIDYDPGGFVEPASAAIDVVKARMKGDLERFKAFIEDQGSATGAWRSKSERYSEPGLRADATLQIVNVARW